MEPGWLCFLFVCIYWAAAAGEIHSINFVSRVVEILTVLAADLRVKAFETLPPFLHYLTMYQHSEDLSWVILNFRVLATFPIHLYMKVTLKEELRGGIVQQVVNLSRLLEMETGGKMYSWQRRKW